MDEHTMIVFSDTGYSNDAIGLRYLEFFIQHATENGKNPALLLYNGANSHTMKEFNALAKVSTKDIILLYIY